MTKKAKNKVPELRFPEFQGDWETGRVDHFLVRYVNLVKVEPETIYKEIGIRSHGKGIFHKEPVTGEALGNKRVYWVHPEAFTVNIVFAWEQAVALTSSGEQGYIASHRFLMFLPRENRAALKFVLLFFLRKRGKHLLELASPGGAGRNKTLGQDSFAELEITLPKKEEQEKIASFFGAVDALLTQLHRKRELLQSYKLGVMQKIFSQQIRFKKDDGTPFSDWQKKKLNELLFEHKKRNYDLFFSKDDVLSVSRDVGIVNQIQHLGRSYAGESIANYHVVNIGDIVYTKSLLKNNPYGIIKANKGKAGIVSTLYAVYSCKDGVSSDYLDCYFSIDENINEYLRPLVHKGAKNDMKINNQRVLIDSIVIPCFEEQKKIVKFLALIDKKIEAVSRQIECAEKFKKGLLQKMFV